MQRKLTFTATADRQLTAIEADPAKTGLLGQINKALGFLELDPRHPSLRTHKYTSLQGERGKEVFEAYAQNNTPGAYRIFWHYGPDEVVKRKRTAVITIIAITPHP